jgi:hypothetical protein
VFSVSPAVLEARFRFVASDDGREVTVSGWFTAGSNR